MTKPTHKENIAFLQKAGLVIFLLVITFSAVLYKPEPEITVEEKAAKARADEQRQEVLACGGASGAFTMANAFMKRRLKSPSTADFPYLTFDKPVIYLKNCTFDVFSYVDAQNSYGATIRTNFYAQVQYKKNSGEWQLIELKNL